MESSRDKLTQSYKLVILSFKLHLFSSNLFYSARVSTWTRSPTWERGVLMTRCWKRSEGRIQTSFEKEKKSKKHLEIFPYGLVRKRERRKKKKSTLLPFYFWLQKVFVCKNSFLTQVSPCQEVCLCQVDFLLAFYAAPWKETISMNTPRHSQPLQWFESRKPHLSGASSLHHLSPAIHTAWAENVSVS